jgi:hypothetical protein
LLMRHSLHVVDVAVPANGMPSSISHKKALFGRVARDAGSGARAGCGAT